MAAEPPEGKGQRRRRFGRVLGDVALTIGMAHGVTGRRTRDDAFLARSAMLSEAKSLVREDRPPSTGLLDRVPGWLVLAIVAVVLAAVLLFTTWQ